MEELTATPQMPRARTGRRRLTLATDLDGTFAGGTVEERRRLQATLREECEARLIYVTGRTVGAARALMEEAGLPHPDVLVADVGTTVVRGDDFRPVPEIEAELERAWPGADVVRQRLRTAGLKEQDVRAPRRVSYWVVGDVQAAVTAALERLSGLDVEVVGSAGVYLDVLPGGIHKGSTLLRVLKWLAVDAADVVVAGDTLNDLALFELGLPGVVVGNHEPALRERVATLGHLYRARGVGAAGILEALVHFGWVEEARHGE